METSDPGNAVRPQLAGLVNLGKSGVCVGVAGRASLRRPLGTDSVA